MRRATRLSLALLTVTLVLLALGLGRVVSVPAETEHTKHAELYQRVARERFHAAERLVRSFYEDGDSGDVLAAAVPGSIEFSDRPALRDAIDEELAQPFGEPELAVTTAREVELVRVSNERVDWCVDATMRVLVDCVIGVGVLDARVENARVRSDGAFLTIHDAHAMLEVMIAPSRTPYDLPGDFRLDSTTGVPRPVEQPEVLLDVPGGDLVPVTSPGVIHVPPHRGVLLRFYGAPGEEGVSPGLVDDHVLRWDGGAVHLSIAALQWFVGLDESVSALGGQLATSRRPANARPSVTSSA